MSITNNNPDTSTQQLIKFSWRHSLVNKVIYWKIIKKFSLFFCFYISPIRSIRKSSNLSTNPENFIPWINTENINKSRSMLKDMYNYLSEDSPIKVFIKTNCSHLLQSPKGHTGHSKDYFEIDKFIFYKNVNSLPIYHSNSFTESLKNN